MKKYLSAILMCSFILTAAGCSSAKELSLDATLTNEGGGVSADPTGAAAPSGTSGGASAGTSGEASPRMRRGVSSGASGEASAGTPDAAPTGASGGASTGAPDAAPTGAPDAASTGAPDAASTGAPDAAPTGAPDAASTGTSPSHTETSPSATTVPAASAGDAYDADDAGVLDHALTDIGAFEYAKTDGAFGVMEEAEAAADIADWEYFPSEPAPDCPVPCPPYIEQPQPSAGLLTGGEWRDNDHWPDWNALYDTRTDWAGYKDYWRIDYDTRVTVKVTADGKPLEGAVVTFEKPSEGAVSGAVTDNKGLAYLFYSADNAAPEEVTVSFGGEEKTAAIDSVGSAECDLSGVKPRAQKKLDFMIMCDTTGSMSDELSYLKEELLNIISRVREENANIPTRLSVNFYRDEGDEYVIREYPFTEDFDAAADAISQQYANGGGDTPEAVHTALDSAVNNHDWDEDSVKIMFLVLDAPPHGDDAQIVDSVNSLIAKAAEKGIRVIPIASSGIDKSTEYLLRTMAFTTGGTYTFLTDDSGVGGGHIEPTVGAYNVEKLNDMMVRIVGGYLK